MRTLVLGAAAGGGFPQWNCGCPNCVGVREGRHDLVARTQDAIAATADGARFVLVNTSPDVLTQIQRAKALWPRGPRHTPISAIILTNGDMDHVLGLFSLRESQPLALYATRPVLAGLEQSAFIRTMRRFEGQLVARELAVDTDVALADAAGEPLGITARAFATPGKLPVHFVGHAEPSPDDAIGVSLSEPGGASLAYATACASLEGLDLSPHAAVLFDGTFYREDELVRLGLSKAHAKDMAHMPISGPSGSLAQLASLGARKVYTHINNTNPILAASEERRAVEAAGWEIAYDGMEIVT